MCTSARKTVCTGVSMEKPRREGSCLLTDKGKAWTFLAGIKLSSLQPNVSTEDFYEETAKPDSRYSEEPDVYTVSNAMACSLCDSKFDTRQQQKDHYRLDWHRFNLKRRMMGLDSITEDEFAQLADDVSSISGSGDSSSAEDDKDMSPVSPARGNQTHQLSSLRKTLNSSHQYDSDDDGDYQKQGTNGTRLPRIYFENDEGQVVSVYRCIVHSKKDAPISHTELISRSLDLLSNRKWAIMITGGGHFAAAVYDGPEVTVHKTFHRYTVRAKRGTVQSVRDSQGNAPKSAGASIRRYNEAALNQEVQDLLASWKVQLDACHRIFLRVPTYNKAMFYGGKNPALDKADTRVLTLPFATRRATFKELKRVWELLATVECHGSVAEVEQKVSKVKQRTEWQRGRKAGKGQAEPLKDLETMEAILTNLEKHSLEDGLKETTECNVKHEEQLVKGDDELEDGGADDVDLVVEEMTASTNHLKEFEISGNKKPRKKKKKKEQNQQPKKDPEEASLTSDLFTICRTGDVDKLAQVISKIHERFSTLTVAQDGTVDSPNSTNCNQDERQAGGCDPVSPDDYGKSDVDTCVTEKSDKDPSVNIDRSTVHENSPRNAIPHLEGAINESSVPNRTTVQLDQSQQDCLDQCEGDAINDPSKESQDCQPGKKLFKFLNKPLDDMGYTFLHVAAEDGQREVLYRLMESGADPGVKNKKGKPPYGSSLDKPTRDEFRRFRANHPDRYDYERAQIPAPLSEVQEREKAAKQAERKRVARKAKRAREKEQKEEQEKQKKEDEKKNWYASLSDREKRGLAAEKRFAKQTTSTTDLQRCWSCGSSLVGKVPFSYMEFKFCSMPCLRQHKQH